MAKYCNAAAIAAKCRNIFLHPLQRGYLVTQIGGQDAGNLMTVAGVLSTKKKGEPVPLTVVAPRRVGGNFVEYPQGTINVPAR